MEKECDRSSFQKSKDEQIDSNDGKNHSDVEKHLVFSEEEAACLEERLNNKETFKEALQVLITWLEEGVCDERSSARFYTLILICWNRFTKLKTEKNEYLDEVQMTGGSLLNKSCCIQRQLNQIEEVFKTIEKKSIVDNFTEDQKNKIKEMKTDIFSLKEDIMKESYSVVEEGESSIAKTVPDEEILSKVGSSTSGLNNVNQKGCDGCLKEIARLQSELENSRKRIKKNNLIAEKRHQNSDVSSQCDPPQVYPSEMDMISFLSVFLFENPGVNIERIYSHFKKAVSTSAEIENLMRRYPKLFKESSVAGDDQEKKWTFIAVDPKTLTEFNNTQ